jgi:zinc carboxypeptidase
MTAALALVTALLVQTPTHITSPKQALGFNIGDDYHLATYTQLEAYWRTLARESPRMQLREIGKSAEGRTQLMAIITSPANMAHLARYQEIAQRLAHAEGLTDAQAHALADEGKAVVWIDGGLHATEVLGAHQLMELVYEMVSRNDPETRRILNDVIILAVHANPDGMELVSSWYMRDPDTLKRAMNIPRLYQKYIGHDDNRDFYMVTQPETQNMTNVMFRQWFPEIVYNHHQTGPAGAVLFAPPFRDPFNYNLDPLIPLGIEIVGTEMHARLAAEGKPGATMRSGSSYSTWWNGGLRTTAYFHNMIGLLTETIGNPTPFDIQFVPDRQLPKGDLAYPVEPQRWHFRQSIEYSMTMNRAVLDYASRYRETLLYNIYLMGRHSIDRGNRDSWTIHPQVIDAVKAAAARDRAGDSTGGRRGFGRDGALPVKYFALLHDPAQRDPRGYILPADQPDFPTATKFVNTLLRNGITVLRATAAFDVAGKHYPAGSFVIKTAQAFRPHVLDMFEPQDHPNDFQYPGGPPIPPYDNAGWTLAYQMGVQFDRILDGFSGPFVPVPGPAARPPAGTLSNLVGAAGFLLDHRVNDVAIVTNRLLAGGQAVYWLKAPITINGRTYPAGTVYVPATPASLVILKRAAAQLGVNGDGVAAAPSGDAMKLRPLRIALWDRYGGSMPSGWTRWLLERYEFPFQVVYPAALDTGRLSQRFDVVIFPTGAVPDSDAAADGGGGGGGFGATPDPERLPPEYRGWLGRVTVAKTVPQLRQFLEDGGTIVTIGSSTILAHHLGLPVTSHLVADGRPLPRTRFYVPGSLLQARVDSTLPVAWGEPGQVDVFFEESPAFDLAPAAGGTATGGVQSVAWYDSDHPLRSGWAWGQQVLKDAVAMAEAPVGEKGGRLYLFGPELLNRGQPHGTFKFFFNAIYLAGATPGGPASSTGGER